jgi:hypothetical protein
VQGAYRLIGGSEVLIESFVAAPGPAGWRYFAHVHPPGDPERDRFTVDLVTGLRSELVRFRLVAADGWRAVAMPADGGVEIAYGPPEDERVARVEEAVAVWSFSPSSLLVLHRLLGPGGGAVRGVRIEPSHEPAAAQLSLTSLGTSTDAGGEAERIRVIADGRELEARVRADLPLAADGWFELLD